MQVKRVVIIGTSVVFFGTTLTLKTKIGVYLVSPPCLDTLTCPNCCKKPPCQQTDSPVQIAVSSD